MLKRRASVHFSRVAGESELKRLSSNWGTFCEARGFPLSKKVVSELNARIQRAGSKHDKAKLNFSGCGLTDDQVVLLVEELSRGPIISKLELGANALSSKSITKLRNLLLQQLAMVSDMPLDDRLSASLLGEVEIGKQDFHIDEKLLDEIEGLSVALRIENAKAHIRKIYVAQGSPSPIEAQDLQKLWQDVIGDVDKEAMSRALDSGHEAFQLNYAELESALIEHMTERDIVRKLDRHHLAQNNKLVNMFREERKNEAAGASSPAPLEVTPAAAPEHVESPAPRSSLSRLFDFGNSDMSPSENEFAAENESTHNSQNRVDAPSEPRSSRSPSEVASESSSHGQASILSPSSRNSSFTTNQVPFANSISSPPVAAAPPSTTKRRTSLLSLFFSPAETQTASSHGKVDESSHAAPTPAAPIVNTQPQTIPSPINLSVSIPETEKAVASPITSPVSKEPAHESKTDSVPTSPSVATSPKAVRPPIPDMSAIFDGNNITYNAVIQLANLELTTEICQTRFVNMASSSKINSLILRNNNIQLPGSLSFQATFPALVFLDLAGNNITDIDCAMFPKTLLRLDLSFNNISDTSNIIFLPKLKSLDLSYNKLKNLSNLPATLERLDLSNNFIAHTTVLRMLALLTTLTHVYVKGNPICDTPAKKSSLRVTLKSTVPSLREVDGDAYPIAAKPSKESPLNKSPTSKAFSPDSATSPPVAVEKPKISKQSQVLADQKRTEEYQKKLKSLEESRELLEKASKAQVIGNSKLSPVAVENLTRRLAATSYDAATGRSTTPIATRSATPNRMDTSVNRMTTPNRPSSRSTTPNQAMRSGGKASQQRPNTRDPVASMLNRVPVSEREVYLTTKQAHACDLIDLWVSGALTEISRAVAALQMVVNLSNRPVWEEELRQSFCVGVERVKFYTSGISLPDKVETAIATLNGFPDLIQMQDMRYTLEKMVALSTFLHDVHELLLANSNLSTSDLHHSLMVLIETRAGKYVNDNILKPIGYKLFPSMDSPNRVDRTFTSPGVRKSTSPPPTRPLTQRPSQKTVSPAPISPAKNHVPVSSRQSRSSSAKRGQVNSNSTSNSTSNQNSSRMPGKIDLHNHNAQPSATLDRELHGITSGSLIDLANEPAPEEHHIEAVYNDVQSEQDEVMNALKNRFMTQIVEGKIPTINLSHNEPDVPIESGTYTETVYEAQNATVVDEPASEVESFVHTPRESSSNEPVSNFDGLVETRVEEVSAALETVALVNEEVLEVQESPVQQSPAVEEVRVEAISAPIETIEISQVQVPEKPIAPASVASPATEQVLPESVDVQVSPATTEPVVAPVTSAAPAAPEKFQSEAARRLQKRLEENRKKNQANNNK